MLATALHHGTDCKRPKPVPVPPATMPHVAWQLYVCPGCRAVATSTRDAA